MSRGSTLIRNLGLIGLGRVSAQAVALLLLPVLTGGLSPAEYGIVELVVTYVSLCAPLVSLQLEMAAFRFLVSTRNDPEETKATISTVGLPIVVFALFWAVAGFVLGYLIDYRLLWYFAVNLVSVILFNLVIQVARGVGRNVLFAVGNIAVALTTLAAVSSAVFFKIFSLEIYLSVLAGANAIGILIVFFSLRFYRLCDFRLFTIARLKNLLRYSLPLIPNSLSWWVISAAGRTVTAVFLGVYYVGLLAVASKFAAIVTGLSTVFSMAWMEAASVSYDDTDSPSFFSEVVNQALRFFSALTILIICAVPIMMTFLVDDDFADAYYYIPILLMGALGHSMVSFYSGVLIAQNSTTKVANTSIAAAALSLGISLSLVHWIGLYAVAIATPVAFFFMVIYRQYVLQRELQVRYRRGDLAAVVSSLAAILILYYLRVDSLAMLLIGILVSLILIAPAGRSLRRRLAARRKG